MKLHALQNSPLQLSNRIERHYIEAVTERKYYASNFEKKKADIHKILNEKIAVTYHKEEVQAEVMTPPPAADQQKIPGKYSGLPRM